MSSDLHAARKVISLESVLRIGIVAGFVVVGAVGIGRPGLLYDEVLFVNASLGGIGEDHFIHQRLFGVPFLLMDYIGALKAWIYAPIFDTWGVTPETVRLPAFALMAAALYVYGRLAAMLFGGACGIVVLVLIATDPAFFFASRVDYGPVAVMSFLKAVSLCLFFAWLRRPSNAKLAALFLSLALGVFDKVNFVWFALALGAAAFAFRERVATALRSTRPTSWAVLGVPLVAAAAVGAAYLLPLFLHYETGNESGSVLSAERLTYVGAMVRETLLGRGARAILFPPTRAPALGRLVLIAGLLLGGALAAGTRRVEIGREAHRHFEPARVMLFFAALWLVNFVLIVVTRQATQPHHMFMLHPESYFVLLGTAAAVVTSVRLPWRRVLSYGLSAVAGLAIASHVRHCVEYLDQTARPTEYTSWASPAIYALARRVADVDADLVVSAEWGLHNQLFALAAPETRERYRDRWAFFSTYDAATPETRRHFLEDHYAGRTTLTVLHAPGTAPIPGARAGFFDLMRDAERRMPAPEIVRGPGERALYELHLSTPAATTTAFVRPAPFGHGHEGVRDLRTGATPARTSSRNRVRADREGSR